MNMISDASRPTSWCRSTIIPMPTTPLTRPRIMANPVRLQYLEDSPWLPHSASCHFLAALAMVTKLATDSPTQWEVLVPWILKMCWQDLTVNVTDTTKHPQLEKKMFGLVTCRSLPTARALLGFTIAFKPADQKINMIAACRVERSDVGKVAETRRRTAYREPRNLGMLWNF